MKDTRKTSQKKMALPIAMAFVIISTLWVVFNYMDWIYLTFTIVSMAILAMMFKQEVKRSAEREELLKEQEKNRMEDRIRHMAYYDDFTGLPNRRLFFDELTQALEKHDGTDRFVAVMFIDIDRFKLVNESLGHDYGDILLMQIAERLMRDLKDNDFVARLEGDEFALFFSNLEHKDEAKQIAQTIMKNMAPVFYLQEYHLHVTVSIGVSLSSEQDGDVENLMKYANMALSRAKELGRNNYQFHTPAMNIRSYEKLTLENDLRRAIEHEEFTVFYQPQVNAMSGEIVGAEALIRWNHPSRGVIHPSEFIPLAEENGMIVPIGDWVIYKVCKQNKAWQDEGYSPFPISVNLSIRQFLRHDISGRIADVLTRTNLKAHFLELEITESMTMDVQNAINSLHELKSLGIGISMDDFGTGYSSLSYLKKFPINKLKIDRSFVRDIMRDPNDAAIVSTIIAMAHELDLKVIAEGVETEEQLNYLREKKCNEVQGFLFSPPIKAESFVRHMKLLA